MTGGLAYLLKTKAAPTGIFPHSPLEATVYFFLAMTAGYCEELIFRGYLMQQFGLRTSSKTMGILLQAVVFGLAHGYQGITHEWASSSCMDVSLDCSRTGGKVCFQR